MYHLPEDILVNSNGSETDVRTNTMTEYPYKTSPDNHPMPTASFVKHTNTYNINHLFNVNTCAPFWHVDICGKPVAANLFIR